MITLGAQVVLRVVPGCGGESRWHCIAPSLDGHAGFVEAVDPTQQEDPDEHKVSVIVHGWCQWFRPSELQTPDGNSMDVGGPVMVREQP